MRNNMSERERESERDKWFHVIGVCMCVSEAEIVFIWA